MKKAITLLLCALMVFTITFGFGVAYAEGNGGNTPENRMVLDEETNPEIPSAQESAEDSRYVNMTTEELYDYLSTLETQEEVQAVRDQLTPEQLAALDVYTQSQEQEEQDGQAGQSGQEPEEPAASETPVNPAQNYTEVAPLGDPVEIPELSVSGMAIQTMDASEEEDALVLDKTVASREGGYLLTIEAYATGEVTITTGDPLPADIVLVLDVSGSMNSNMTGSKYIDALKTAVTNFIDTVVSKATSIMNHRIAVVTFALSSSIISGNGTASGAFVDANNDSSIVALKNTINHLEARGTQAAVSGLDNAVSIFGSDQATGTRNRVVIYLGGGTPKGNELDSDSNNAIEYAHQLKIIYGATVYSVGVFKNANPTTPISQADNDNKYMHLVSSNYPDATSMEIFGAVTKTGYYLSTSDSAGLNDIFENIAIRIGGTTVTLDETAVIKDMIAPYFKLPDGAVTNDIHVYTSAVYPDVDATERWKTPVAFTGAQVTISADGKTISVSGFDYTENYYAAIKTDEGITGYQGKKLIIEIPIVYIQGSCFGGTVPTNKPTSGIYEEDFFVEALPIPTVDIPVTYDFTQLNQSIYITQNATVDSMFTTAAGFAADGVNNAYVSIVYTVIAPGGTVLGTYTIPAGATTGSWSTLDRTIAGLTGNTTYTISCTVTPVSESVTPLTVSKTAKVYVWKPEVTFRDSVIYLGETANYSDNYVPAVWKNSTASAPSPSGAAPDLIYEFTPAAGAFTVDTYVKASVKIGSTDITGNTSFVHQACSPVCGFNPASGQFLVHVKTCSLTVTKTGAEDATDTFIFTITGNGVTLRVSVQGNGSQTIVGLPVGTYTVTEASGWSWRYDATSVNVTLSHTNATASVTVQNELENDRWLSGDSQAVNSFPPAG